MKKSILIAIFSFLVACVQPSQKTVISSEKQAEFKVPNLMTYPDTKKGDVIDEYFGVDVADPYRWLEDDVSAETAAWVKAQNELTFGYLENIRYRDTLAERLRDQLNYAVSYTHLTLPTTPYV